MSFDWVTYVAVGLFAWGVLILAIILPFSWLRARAKRRREIEAALSRLRYYDPAQTLMRRWPPRHVFPGDEDLTDYLLDGPTSRPYIAKAVDVDEVER